jgi:HK97 gp10 family phage protein
MSNRMDIEVEGADELIRQLRRLGVSTQKALKVAALAGGEVIRQAADPLAPSPVIDKEVVESTKSKAVVDIGPPEDKWYYQFFETGAGPHDITGDPLVFEGDEGTVVTEFVDHPGMAASPFLRPAFDSKKGQAKKEVGGELKRAVQRVAR